MLLICTSHSPLMLVGMEPVDPRKNEGFFASLSETAKLLQDYDPELVVVFGPDHFHWLYWDLMPAYCIGVEAISNRDWDLPEVQLDVPRDLAIACVRHVQRADIDVSVSYRMRVDHGHSIPLLKLAGSLDRYPVLPVMLNCAADPRPSFRRTRQFGEAVGSFLRTLGNKRIAIIGSGGLSHDPPGPRLEKLLPDAAARFIDRHVYTKEEYDTYQARVIEACKIMAKGGKSLLPPSEQWDRAFMASLIKQDLTAFDNWTDEKVDAEGGFGGHEVRCWLAAFAAMHGAGGTYSARERFHAVIPEWGTGMGIATGAHHSDTAATSLI